MTLEEKIGQLVLLPAVVQGKEVTLSQDQRELVREGKAGAILNLVGAEATDQVQAIAIRESRLGIPLVFAADVIQGRNTIFPIPLALAASWNPSLVREVARRAAEEAWASGVRWTFSPMLDVSRDPRWGRMAEGPGEDPYLASRLARAWVEGFQGKGLGQPGTLASCPKHFVAYGAAEGGRDYNSVEVSDHLLWEVYLPPFLEAIRAGAPSIMAAFVSLNGIPAVANQKLLRDLLRKQLGFQGVIVSDWGALGELTIHGVAKDRVEAAFKALRAGIDMDMSSEIYLRNLGSAVRAKRELEALLEEAVLRVLEFKRRLHLWEHPFTQPLPPPSASWTKLDRELARKAATQTFVLLKNEGGVLPLSPTIRRIALVGPLFDNSETPLGPWRTRQPQSGAVTLLEALQEELGDRGEILTAGWPWGQPTQRDKAKVLACARQADVVLLSIGELVHMDGESASRATLGLPAGQEELVELVASVHKPAVAILFNGRALALPELVNQVPALLEVWFPGVESGHAICDVLLGKESPSGRLPVSFPRSVGQLPVYYNHRRTGRPPGQMFTSRYIDSPVDPLFPFGYGLTYTQFQYGACQSTPRSFHRREKIRVGAWIQNVGKRPGEEVVQLYVRALSGELARPIRELKGFQRIYLLPGQRQWVEFSLQAEDLGYWDPEGVFRVEPGIYQVWISPNSQEGIPGTIELLEG
ncbi:glycoside hydrolase family 3 N-terminal domain-containing protein [Candidatus Methylacidithermus pantelleriae]|nr:glycoside hydrolase family 3 N-terminal domain-containing protein [Candidatus Methylacidithermus pantelleriae]